jgi:hypothetical protein
MEVYFATSQLVLDNCQLKSELQPTANYYYYYYYYSISANTKKVVCSDTQAICCKKAFESHRLRAVPPFRGFRFTAHGLESHDSSWNSFVFGGRGRIRTYGRKNVIHAHQFSTGSHRNNKYRMRTHIFSQ